MFALESWIFTLCVRFTEIPSSIVGEHLRKQVEDRLKYIDGGENPRKNIDVMKEAVAEVRNRVGSSACVEKVSS